MESNAAPNRYTHLSPIMVPTCSRSVNASSSERSLLLRVMSSHLGVLDARDNDSRTLRHKSLLWEQVTQRFNSMSSLPRSRHQIQTLFKNMKAKAKKYQQRLVEAQIKEAPHISPEPDPISEMLLQLLAGQHEQRLMHLKQTALNLSGDLTVDVSPNDLIHERISPQGNYISPSGNTSCDDLDSNTEVKNESTESESKASRDPLLTENVSFTHRSGKRSEEVLFPLSENSSEYFPVCPSIEKDRTEKNSSPEPNGHSKRLRTSQADQVKNTSQFFRYEFPQVSSRDFRNEDSHNNFFSNSFISPLSEMNKLCCCPNVHSELLKMAKAEHELRMRIQNEEREFKQERHKAKINLLKAEQELCKRKLSFIEGISQRNKALNVNSETMTALGLTDEDALYDNRDSVCSRDENFGNDFSSKDISSSDYQNELDKLCNSE